MNNLVLVFCPKHTQKFKLFQKCKFFHDIIKKILIFKIFSSGDGQIVQTEVSAPNQSPIWNANLQ